jgi:Carboxypeptidase regulatory-like domain
MRTHTTLRRSGNLAVVFALSSSAVFAQQPPRPVQPPPGTVTLSLAEYDRLVDRAERPARRADPPPIPAIVARSDGQVRVVGDRARGTFTLEGEVFASGVTAVPLMTGATIIDARLGTTSIALTREGEMNAALVEGPRAFSITLEWGAPVQQTPGRASLAVPAPMTGAVNAVFELPGTAGDVQISPGAVTRTTAGPNGTRVEATLVAATPSRLSWATKRVEATPREARKVAEVKSLVSLRDAELRVTSLVEVSVLAGQPDRIEMTVPDGFVFEGASGGTVEPAGTRPDVVVVRIERPLERRHQVLVSFERQASATGRIEIALPTVIGAERESGEVAVEASGTVELKLTESDVLRRMDVREASRALGSLAGQTVLAAMRYSRRGSTPATLSLDLTRFPDAPLITAVADRAVATTLLTVDGRTLTEVVLTLRNRAQPFLRVELPAGASMISAEVAGETAKIAQGADGVRVPLLRPGFRPSGPYAVSFVYVHSGQPFAKKGRAGLVLPRMDVPIGLVEWEMFVPDRYRVRHFDGDALLQPPLPPSGHDALGVVGGAKAGGAMSGIASGIGVGAGGGAGGGEFRPAPGQLVGVVTDEGGAALPGATITLIADGTTVSQTTANASGWFLLPATGRGRVTVVADVAGFKRVERRISFDPARPRRLDFRLAIGELSETVTVASDNEGARDASAQAAPSQNVFNLQQRVAGVLPVRIDVPRAGAAYRFVRPLVLDEPTTVSFDYRTR